MPSPPVPAPFSSAKRTILHKLRASIDYSPKGDIDAPIRALITSINALPDLVSTSSCSGRVALYAHTVTTQGDSEKGAGEWLLVEHGVVDARALADAVARAPQGATVTLLVEPMILHVQAATQAAAVRLLAVALRAGFRESGIVEGSSGRGKLIVAVRSTASALEAPIQWHGVRIVEPFDAAGAVGPQFLTLVGAANDRMREVDGQRARFDAEFRAERGSELLAVTSCGGAAPPRNAEAVAVCTSCSGQFSSRNALFKHLVRGAEKLECPQPRQARALALECRGCNALFPSRNRLFRHVAACVRAQRLKQSTSASHSSAIDAIEVESRYRAKALLQRMGVEFPVAKSDGVARLTGDLVSPLIAPLETSGAPAPSLNRWSHCAVFIPDVAGLSAGALVVLFGISGTTGGRSADLVVMDVATQRLHLFSAQSTEVVARPSPRVRTAATLLRLLPSAPSVFVFGGHAGVASPLDDAWLVRFESRAAPAGEDTITAATWTPLQAAGATWPEARWGHTLDAESAGGALLFGGRDAARSFGDTWRLAATLGATTGATCTATRLTTTGAAPCPRFAHASAATESGRLVIHGGIAWPFSNNSFASHAGQALPNGVLCDFAILDVSTLTWTAPTLEFSVPRAVCACGVAVAPRVERFTHSMTALSRNRILIFGGESSGVAGAGAIVVDLTNMSGRVCAPCAGACGPAATGTPLGRQFYFSRHTATRINGDALAVVGGGGVAFAFGSHFSPPTIIESLAWEAEVSSASGSGEQPSREFASDASPADVGCWGLLLRVPPSLAETCKAEVSRLGLLDSTRTVGPLPGGGALGIPLTIAARAVFDDTVGGAAGVISPSFASALAVGSVRIDEGVLPAFVARGGNDGGMLALERVAKLLQALLIDAGFTAERADELSSPGRTVGGAPRRVSWLGDILLLPRDAFRAPEFEGDGGRLAKLAAGVVGKALRAERVARGAAIDAGVTRASHVELLLSHRAADGAFTLPAREVAVAFPEANADGTGGDLPQPWEPPPATSRVDTAGDGWVRVRESGVELILDVTRVMFSAGNAPEKARMGALGGAAGIVGETVVDLYAGIGYFSLPILVRARAHHVHCAEWNPDALTCLALGMAANGVSRERVTLWPGDNRRLLDPSRGVRGTAHRVLLGLIPSSRRGWPVAVAMLRAEGGVLHVHENGPDGPPAVAREWAEREMLPELTHLARLENREWTVAIERVVRVKSYRPHVAHYVVDVVFKRA